jgi:hypothetical protein
MRILHVWQGKELLEKGSAMIGDKDAPIDGREKCNTPFEAHGKEAQRTRRPPGVSEYGIPPPRVPCEKSLDLLDCKGFEFFGSNKELVTVSNGEG